jgi:hypothetical protein
MRTFLTSFLLFFSMSLSLPMSLSLLLVSGETSSALASTQQTSPPVIVSTRLNKAKIELGEKATFTIQVKYHTDFGQKWPLPNILEIGDQIVGLRIVETGTNPSREDPPYMVMEKWYQLETDISGSFVLPAAQVEYQDPKTQEKKTLSTSETFLEVVSKEAKDAKDEKDGKDGKNAGDKNSGKGNQGNQKNQAEEGLRDIKGLAPVPKAYLLFAILGLVILTGAAAFGLWWWKFKNRGKRSHLPPELPAHERAFLALSQLINNPWENPTDGKASKNFHFELSFIVRSYLENLLSLNATDMTYEEIKKHFPANHPVVNVENKNQVLQLLAASDSVKFAGNFIARDESLKMVQTAQKFVQETKPQEQAPTESVI